VADSARASMTSRKTELRIENLVQSFSKMYLPGPNADMSDNN